MKAKEKTDRQKGGRNKPARQVTESEVRDRTLVTLSVSIKTTLRCSLLSEGGEEMGKR